MDDSEIRKKGAEVAALREDAARVVAAACSEGRELTKEEDGHVLALLSRMRALEE